MKDSVEIIYQRNNKKKLETGRTGYDNAPDDSDNDFLCAVQLQRIANSLEEVIRMVKLDQAESKKRWEKEDE